MRLRHLCLTIPLLLPLVGCGLGLGDVLAAAGSLAAASPAPTSTTPNSDSPPSGSSYPTPYPAAPRVQEPSSSAQTPAAPTAEYARALVAANRERQAAGIGALTWSQPLADVAQRHSQDMARRGFFDHTNPDGLSPFDRLDAAGITYSSAAENIAQNNADDGGAVIAQWMNSAGHRANMLSPNYVRMGLGLAMNPQGQRFWTQDFTD